MNNYIYEKFNKKIIFIINVMSLIKHEYVTHDYLLYIIF